MNFRNQLLIPLIALILGYLSLGLEGYVGTGFNIKSIAAFIGVFIFMYGIFVFPWKLIGYISYNLSGVQKTYFQIIAILIIYFFMAYYLLSYTNVNLVEALLFSFNLIKNSWSYYLVLLFLIYIGYHTSGIFLQEHSYDGEFYKLILSGAIFFFVIFSLSSYEQDAWISIEDYYSGYEPDPKHIWEEKINNGLKVGQFTFAFGAFCFGFLIGRIRLILK
ncbi:hypothetical protein OAP76_06540 [Alphaproteobacteria bacterium]|nr:hypothetical protein [Alphaproteobacteria bacterium]